jgi:membrane protein YdbS with pleckstrin-like domain
MSQRPRVFKRSRRPPNNRLGLCVGSLEVKSNLALRFLLEIGALVAGGYWGWKSADGAARWALAIGAVVAVVVVWTLFVSPNPTIEWVSFRAPRHPPDAHL